MEHQSLSSSARLRASRVLRHLPVLVFVLVGGLAVAQTVDNSGRQIPYTGYLERGGAPVEGSVDLRFSLFTAEGAAEACSTHEVSGAPVASGRFSVLLSDVPDACLEGGEAWLEVFVAEPGSGAFVRLAAPGGGRTRIASVPFAAAVPRQSRFLVGSGEVALEDTALGVTYTLTGSDGVALRPESDPASGQPLFRVQSSDGVERLRVEHDGAVRMDNALFVGGNADVAGGVGVDGDVDVGGDIHEGGRLLHEESFVGSDRGCQRIGDVQTCWVRSTRVSTGTDRADWAKPFANNNYAVTCTGISTGQRVIGLVSSQSTSNATILVRNPGNGDAVDFRLYCIAMGRAGGW